jgi:hypothetical protein
MPFRLSRRRWVLLVGSTPLLAQAFAQTPPTTPLTAAGPPLEKAQADVRQVSDKLAAIEVPMNVEPSFRFTA